MAEPPSGSREPKWTPYNWGEARQRIAEVYTCPLHEVTATASLSLLSSPPQRFLLSSTPPNSLFSAAALFVSKF